MKVTYRIFHGRDFVKADVNGRVDLEASKEALRSLMQDSDVPPDRRMLLDLRDAKCEMSVTDVYWLVEAMVVERLKFADRTAILALCSEARDLADFMGTAGGNRGLKIRAFADEEEARQWLGDADDEGATEKNMVVR